MLEIKLNNNDVEIIGGGSRVTARTNGFEKSLSIAIPADKPVVLARTKTSLALTVYVFDDYAAMEQFLELARPNFVSLEEIEYQGKAVMGSGLAFKQWPFEAFNEEDLWCLCEPENNPQALFERFIKERGKQADAAVGSARNQAVMDALRLEFDLWRLASEDRNA